MERPLDTISPNAYLLEETLTGDIGWQANQLETQSQTHLEDDEGYGDAAVIRCFTFSVNPESWKQHKPTKQELFNSHYQGIEVMLWKDGMTIMPESNPRIIINKKKKNKLQTYQIFVGAKPARGQMLLQTPNKLVDYVTRKPESI